MGLGSIFEEGDFEEGESKVAFEVRRVGYVLKRYPRYSETFIVNEILAHEAAGLEVEIFALRPPNDQHFQDAISRVRARVNYLPSEGLKASDLWAEIEQTSEVLPGLWTALKVARGEDVCDLYQAVRLAREVKLKGIDHLHAHFATVATSVARLAARFAQLPYTFTAHAKDIFHHSVQPAEMRRKLKEAAAVLTVSDFNRAYLQRTYGPAAARVERIYNGLELERFPYQAPLERPSRIVAVGRLVEKKGFADLIEACAILASRDCRFECHIIGVGPLESQLQAQIERAGLQAQVQLLGPRPQREVIDEVQSAAVLVAPCVVASDEDRDGLPTVLLEAMALGTPCISTDVTGIPEVIRDGETGLLVPQRNPLALSTAIVQMLSQPAHRAKLAEQARRLIETHFDSHRNAAQLRAIFQQAAGERKWWEVRERPPLHPLLLSPQEVA